MQTIVSCLMQALKREASQERFSWRQGFTAEQISSSAVGEVPSDGELLQHAHGPCSENHTGLGLASLYKNMLNDLS